MVNSLPVNSDHRRDFHPLADQVTKCHQGYSASPFSFQLVFHQIVTNLIVFLTISEKQHTKVVQTSQHVSVDTR